VGDLGLDPETALKLLQALLRGAAYFFAGFALFGLFAYVVFLCREIFTSRPRAKVRFTKVVEPVGCASVVEQNHELFPVDTPKLVKEATVTGVEVLRES
jgi:bacteriorhodopsin